MENKFFKGLDLAMIPSGIVGIISIGFMLIIGIGFLGVFHLMLFESIFEGKTNIYCLLVVAFFDSTIFLFLWGVFGKKAIAVFLVLVLLVLGIWNIGAVFKVGIPLVCTIVFICAVIGSIVKATKGNSTGNDTVSSSSPKSSSMKSSHSDLADKF